MRHIRVRSYFLFFLAVILALSGPISSVTFFAQSSSAIDDATLDIFAENNIMFYDPSEQERPDCNSVSGAKPSGDQITWIGDSYSVGSEEPKKLISNKFPGVDYGSSINNSSSYIQDSKFISKDINGNPPGLTILKNIVDAGNLRPYLVFALGTNGGWTDQNINDLISLVGAETKVVLVTSRTENGADYTESNKLIKKAAEDNKNIFVADWASSSTYKSEYYASDPEKIHPYASGGFEAWIDVIHNALPGGSAKSVSGENSVEIIWSYLANTGLFTSEQIAGIIGNALVEVGGYWKTGMDIDDDMLNLNPIYINPSNTGYMYLFQWNRSANETRLNGKLSQYSKYLNDSYIKKTPPSTIPIDDRRGIIETLLKYALEENDAAASNPDVWIKEVQAQTTVTAATEAFLVSYEGAAGNAEYPGQPILEYKGVSDVNKNRVQKKNADGYGYQSRDKRVDAANKIFEMYQGYSGSSTNCNPTAVSSDLILALLQQFVIDSNYLYNENNTIPSTYELNVPIEPPINDNITPTPTSDKLKKLNISNSQDKLVANSGCWHARFCGQCTALSGWFVTMMTSYHYYGGHGRNVVNNLVANNSELSLSPNPTPYSIFSKDTGDEHGHTGVVLEVFDNGEILSIENNMGGSANKLEVHRWKPSTNVSYTSLSNGLNLEHLGTTYD